MRIQISHILVCADDVDDAVGEAEAVLEPGNWDFLTMADIGREPKKFYLVPVELWLV